MSQYKIECSEYDCAGRLTSSCILPVTFTDFKDANAKIKTYAEVQRKNKAHVIHSVGQSVVLFANKRIEFTRISKPIGDY